MCSYLSKEENECSQAMKRTFKETLEKGRGLLWTNGVYGACLLVKKRVISATGCMPHQAKTMA